MIGKLPLNRRSRAFSKIHAPSPKKINAPFSLLTPDFSLLLYSSWVPHACFVAGFDGLKGNFVQNENCPRNCKFHPRSLLTTA